MSHKHPRLYLLLIAVLIAGACGPAPTDEPPNGRPTPPPPVGQPTDTPPGDGPTPPPTELSTTAPTAAATARPTPEPTAAPAPVAELAGQAGLYYTPIPGYTVEYGWHRILLAAPDASPLAGPLVVIDSNPYFCAESVPSGLWEAFERAHMCLPWIYNIDEATITEPVDVQVDKRFGLAAEIKGTISGQEVQVHFVVLKPAPLRTLVLVALAPAGRYPELAGLFAELVASIDLLDWTTYSYANGVQDVAFFEGYLWTATGGGVVNYGLGGGRLPEKYTTVDGLPANDARALSVCPIMGEPVLVAGTWGGGLAWFDMGLRQWFSLGGPYAEWHSHDVRALACAPERNRLIVGYDDGIDIYDADEVLWTLIEQGPPAGLRTLLVSPDGETIWAIGRQEVARIVGYEVTSFPLSGDYLGQAALDAAGRLWIGTDTGLVRLEPDGDWTPYAAAAIPGLANGPVNGLAVAPDGAIWAGSTGQVARFDPQTGQVTAVYTRAQGLGAGWVTRMAAQEDGWVAAGTSTGVSFRRGDEWTFWQVEGEPLLDNQIKALVQDTAGLIWVGTEGGGVYRFDPRRPAGRWDNFYNELPDPSIATLYADPTGGVWVGHVGGISYYFDRKWQHLADEAPELTGLYAYALAKDGRGRLWIGSDMGLALWDGQQVAWLTTADGLPSNQVRALLSEGAAMWVGTLGGLARVEGTAIAAFTTENSGLPANAVNALAPDRFGGILVAAGPYLAWHEAGGSFYTWLETYYGSDIVAIGVAANGAHWATTAREGAYHLVWQGEGADWERVPAQEGPPANSYTRSSILVDRDGTAWLGGATGGVARHGR